MNKRIQYISMPDLNNLIYFEYEYCHYFQILKKNVKFQINFCFHDLTK